MIERMLRPKVCRQRQLRRVICPFIARRPDPRIVRRGEVDMYKKRLLAFLLDQPNRRVGKVGADVGRQPDTLLWKPLAVIRLKLPAAITGRLAAAKINIRLITRFAAAVEAVALLIADV